MTLEELAHELRKIFRFKYLTCVGDGHVYHFKAFREKPRFYKNKLLGFEYWRGAHPVDVENKPMVNASSVDIPFIFDFSEYADADGIIDYSKCIVEVE